MTDFEEKLIEAHRAIYSKILKTEENICLKEDKIYAKIDEGSAMLGQVILDIEGLYAKVNEILKSLDGGKADEITDTSKSI
jgi:hypothetical protein